jgi:hypothetical protein
MNRYAYPQSAGQKQLYWSSVAAILELSRRNAGNCAAEICAPGRKIMIQSAFVLT